MSALRLGGLAYRFINRDSSAATLELHLSAPGFS